MLRKGFTVIELLVVIAIIAILAAILFPVFSQAKVAAKKTQDLSNIKQIGTSIQLYAADNDDQSVVKDEEADYDWFEPLQPYIKNRQVFRTPAYRAGEDAPATDYLLNGLFAHGISLTAFSEPSGQIILSIREQLVEDTDYHPWPGDYLSWDSPSAYFGDEGGGPENWFEERILKAAFGNGANYGFADTHVRFRQFEQTIEAGVRPYPGQHNVDRMIGVRED